LKNLKTESQQTKNVNSDVRDDGITESSVRFSVNNTWR